MIEYIDVIQDLVLGDSGKGKICTNLVERSLKTDKPYTHCLKGGGGSNSGRSSYINGRKFITHSIPSGVLHGVKSIIGCNAVLNVEKFFKELKDLEDFGIKNVKTLVKISKNTHIITSAHLLEDQQDTKIGTTKTGNGPCYREKYNRTGLRACQVPELKYFLIDTYEEFFTAYPWPKCRILVEGSQGYYLDINSDNYPYVTSSHCDIGGVISSGLPWNSLRNIYGVIKSYTTYVGNKNFQPEGEIFEKLQSIGKEFGATTGRKRQTDWNKMKLLKKAIQLNGVTHLIVNKMDVLQELNAWNLYGLNDELINFRKEEDFKEHLEAFVKLWGIKEVVFSYSPEVI
jgi:adenylosuccinate synthase